MIKAANNVVLGLPLLYLNTSLQEKLNDYFFPYKTEEGGTISLIYSDCFNELTILKPEQ